MSKRTRLFAAILLIYLLGVVFLLYPVSTDLGARYRESAEESLVDVAHLLAAVIEDELGSGGPNVSRLRRVFDAAYRRRFAAQIYSLNKSRVDRRARSISTCCSPRTASSAARACACRTRGSPSARSCWRRSPRSRRTRCTLCCGAAS